MEELLCKALDEAYEQEYSKYKTRKKHFFSFRHRKMMRQLFKELDAKPKSEATTEVYTYKAKKKCPTALIVAIIASILLSITIAAISIYSFGFQKHQDHTVVFSENIENAPSIIEYVYTLDPLPDGFEESQRTVGEIVCDITYQKEKDTLTLAQRVKKDYTNNYNTEGYEIEKLDVNGHDGFYIQIKNRTVLVWDNGDYILELRGTLDKNELLNLAKCTKIQKK